MSRWNPLAVGYHGPMSNSRKRQNEKEVLRPFALEVGKNILEIPDEEELPPPPPNCGKCYMPHPQVVEGKCPECRGDFEIPQHVPHLTKNDEVIAKLRRLEES